MTKNNIAFVFPGQGSQSVGMLADIAKQFSEIKQTFAEASDTLSYDLWDISQNGPVDLLNQTVHTQPILLTASFGMWRIIQSRCAIKPVMMAGHSLGEYTALVCAEALSFADAVRLVAARGQFMQDAVPAGVGAMGAIIGLDNEKVIQICEETTSLPNIVSAANFNSIGQVVVAGHKSAVEQAILKAKVEGAKLATLIPVSVPSHCLLMEPAAQRLAISLAAVSLQLPKFPLVNNVAASCDDTVEDIRVNLIKQLYLPVRWVETIQHMTKSGVTQIIECGPGKILTGLNKRIDKNLKLMTTTDIAGLEAVLGAYDA